MIWPEPRAPESPPPIDNPRVLTARQAEVYTLAADYLAKLGEGCTRAYIAKRLNLSPRGCQTHVDALWRKGWLRSTGSPVLPLHPVSRIRIGEMPYSERRQRQSIYPVDRKPFVEPKLRFFVLQRDHFTCQYCGAASPDVALHVDHVIARSCGGTTTADNLTTACVSCNRGKGVMSAEEWRAELSSLRGPIGIAECS